MSVQDIAGVASLPRPEEGQKNRTSENFQFVTVPQNGAPITVSIQATEGADAITAVLVHEIGGGIDVDVTPIGQGSTFSASLVGVGDFNYYIATPSKATTNFAVFFTADV